MVSWQHRLQLVAAVMMVVLLLTFSLKALRPMYFGFAAIKNENEIVLSVNCPNTVNVTSTKDFAVQFIHVPKSGGGPLRTSFTRWANEFNVTITQQDDQQVDWDVSSPYGLFLGHRGYGFSHSVSRNYPYTIVVLRDPVIRIISTYNYIMNTNEDADAIDAYSSFKDKSLDEIVESYVDRGYNYSLATFYLHQLARVQVQYLCGYHCVWPMPKYGEKVEPQGFASLQQQFRLARLNLERIDIVSVVEDMDTMLVNQLRASPFPFLRPPPQQPDFHFPKENQIQPENKQFVKAKTKRLLKGMLAFEYQLYDRAKELSKLKSASALACG